MNVSRLIVLFFAVAVAGPVASLRAQFGVPISPPVPIRPDAFTNNTFDIRPSVAGNRNGVWIIAWDSSIFNGVEYESSEVYARSTDGGATWTAPMTLEAPIIINNSRVLSDGNATWIVAWDPQHAAGHPAGTDSDVYFSRSTDAGLSWTVAAPLNLNAFVDTGNDFVPVLATDERGNWIAVWPSKENLGGTIGTDIDLLRARSVDNGATWSSPSVVNSDAAVDGPTDDEFLCDLATDGTGTWIVTCGRSSGSVYFSRSTDDGLTWSPVALLFGTGDPAKSEGFNPMLTADGRGNWIIAFTSSKDLGGTIGTDTDILLGRSTDGGLTWSGPIALNSDAPTDTFRDRTWIRSLSNDQLGNWVVAWERQLGEEPLPTNMMISRSADNGQTWTPVQALTTATGQVLHLQGSLGTNRVGQWIVTWGTDDPDFGGGAIPEDLEVVLSTFSLTPTAVPAVSQWGVVLMTLLLVTAGTLCIRRLGKARTACR